MLTGWTLVKKPSAFFLSLEKRNSVNKTLNRVVGIDGSEKCTDNDIKDECYRFYEKLYNLKETQPYQLHDFIQTNNCARLKEEQKQDIEGPIQYEELLLALKKMRNNKSPGSDGFTVEFYIMFFIDLSWYLLRSINASYDSNNLSVSRKRGVITLLPKGNKPREFLRIGALFHF